MAGIGQNPADELFADLVPSGQSTSPTGPTGPTQDPADALFADLVPKDKALPRMSDPGYRSPDTGAYKYGGQPGSKEGTDCSGAMCLIGKQAGLKLPRTAKAQFEDKRGKPVASIDQLQPGDLVFFGSPGPSGWHVGFYQGAGKFLHQSTDDKPGLSIGDVKKHAAKFGFKGGKRFPELARQYATTGSGSDLVKTPTGADFAAAKTALNPPANESPGLIGSAVQRAQASPLAGVWPDLPEKVQNVAKSLLAEGQSDLEVAHELLRLESVTKRGRFLNPAAKNALNALVRSDSFARSEALDTDPTLGLDISPAGPTDSPSARRMIRERIPVTTGEQLAQLGGSLAKPFAGAGRTAAEISLQTSGMYGALNPEERSAFRKAFEQGAPIAAAGAVANVATAPLLGGFTFADPVAAGLGAAIFGYGDQDPLFDALAPGALKLLAPLLKPLWKGSQALAKRLSEAAARGDLDFVRRTLVGPQVTTAQRQAFADLIQRVAQRDQALGAMREAAKTAAPRTAARFRPQELEGAAYPSHQTPKLLDLAKGHPADDVFADLVPEVGKTGDIKTTKTTKVVPPGSNPADVVPSGTANRQPPTANPPDMPTQSALPPEVPTKPEKIDTSAPPKTPEDQAIADLLKEFEGVALDDEWTAAVTKPTPKETKRLATATKKRGGTSLFGNKAALTESFRDLSILAGRAISKGVDFAKWSAGIVQSFGTEVGRLAKAAWDKAAAFLKAPTAAADRKFAQRGGIGPVERKITDPGRHVTWKGKVYKLEGEVETAYDEMVKELNKNERKLKKAIKEETNPVAKRRMEAELKGLRRDRTEAMDEFWQGHEEDLLREQRRLSGEDPDANFATAAAKDTKIRHRKVEEQIEDPFEDPLETLPPTAAAVNKELKPGTPEYDEAVRKLQEPKRTVRERWRNFKDEPMDAAVAFVSDTFSRLRHLGEEGTRLAETLTKVMSDAEHIEATLIAKLNDDIRKIYGRAPGAFSAEWKASMGIIAKKVEKGLELTEKEAAVWKSWTDINAQLVKHSKENSILVRRVIGYNAPGNLTNERVKYFDRESGQNKFATVESIQWEGKGQNQKVVGLTLNADGKTIQLKEGDRIFTRQLIDPSAFFPRHLKDEVWKWLKKPGSPEYEEAVKHLLETKQVKDRAMAIAALEDIHGALDLPTGAAVRLERPRLGVRLPDHFYEWDFAKVTQNHIRQSAARIAYAKAWGSQGENLLPQLLKLGDDAGPAARWIGDALGFSASSKGERVLSKVASLEGSITAIRLLTGGTSGIVQLSQFINTFGLLGLKPSLKGMMALAGKSGKQLRQEIRLSGTVSHEDMKMIMGVSEATRASRVADTALTAVGLKHTDQVARIHAAAAGLVAAQDAVRHLARAGDGSLKKNAAYRYLRDFAMYSEADVLRMTTQFERTRQVVLSNQDRRLAFAAGVKTNIRTRAADLPEFASLPLGRVAMRLKTFQYGQAKMFGFTMKELRRGNVVPLLRLTMGGAMGYEGIRRLKGFAISLLEGDDSTATKDNKQFDKALSGVVNHLKEGDFNKAAGSLLDRAYSNFLLGNFTGLYGLPGEAAELQERFPGWKTEEEIMGQFFYPPGAQLPISALGISIRISRSEKDFIQNLKRGGIELAYKEIPLFKRMWRRFHNGRAPKKVK